MPDLLNWYLHFHKMCTCLGCRFKSKEQWPKSDLLFLKRHLDWPFPLCSTAITLVQILSQDDFFSKSHNWFICGLLLTLIYSSNIYWRVLSARPFWVLQRKHFHLEDRQTEGISKGGSMDGLWGTNSSSILLEYPWWVTERGWEIERPGSTSNIGLLSTVLFPNSGQWCSIGTHFSILWWFSC